MMISEMFFNGWIPLLRTLVVGALAYAGLVLFQRITGKRTLSKMNAFDLIVTIALGSTLATVLLSKDVALLEGLVAFALLMGLQLLVTWLSVKSGTISRLVKSEPTMLVHQGEMMYGAMRRERVVEAEVLQAIRSSGLSSLSEVEAVVLETDGTFSVVTRQDEASASSLRNVRRPSQSG